VLWWCLLLGFGFFLLAHGHTAGIVKPIPVESDWPREAPLIYAPCGGDVQTGASRMYAHHRSIFSLLSLSLVDHHIHSEKYKQPVEAKNIINETCVVLAHLKHSLNDYCINFIAQYREVIDDSVEVVFELYSLPPSPDPDDAVILQFHHGWPVIPWKPTGIPSVPCAVISLKELVDNYSRIPFDERPAFANYTRYTDSPKLQVNVTCPLPTGDFGGFIQLEYLVKTSELQSFSCALVTSVNFTEIIRNATIPSLEPDTDTERPGTSPQVRQKIIKMMMMMMCFRWIFKLRPLNRS